MRWGKTEARGCPAFRSAVIRVTLKWGWVARRRTICHISTTTRRNVRWEQQKGMPETVPPKNPFWFAPYVGTRRGRDVCMV